MGHEISETCMYFNFCVLFVLKKCKSVQVVVHKDTPKKALRQ